MVCVCKCAVNVVFIGGVSAYVCTYVYLYVHILCVLVLVGIVPFFIKLFCYLEFC